MSARGDDFNGVAVDVDGLTGNTQTGCGLESQVRDNVLTTGNAAQNAPGIVGQKARGAHLVPVLRPLLADRLKTRADFHALYRIDAQGVLSIFVTMGRLGVEIFFVIE